MTTSTDKTHCVTCGKGKRAYKCEGCSQYFCVIHLPDHQQVLGKQFDEIEDEHNLFRETLIEQIKNPPKHSLIEEINKWENDSVDKIQQTAEEARQLLMKINGEHINEIEIKLTKLTKELEEIRIENDFNEIDLNKFKEKLKELEEQFNKPLDISIQQDSSSFIKKISVSITSDKSFMNINETTTRNNNEGDSFESNFWFKPIVQLSPVEVKTGEEDENVLFCERAKLYRFDSAANQMKERGTGEMKILQHKTTNICRILMRREQVLKLCANHQITSQMELKPHQGSENAYVWSAMDFADGEAKHETLCVRFTSSDTAKNFVKVFDEAKEMNTKKSVSANNTNGGFSFPGFGNTITTPPAGFQFFKPVAISTSTTTTAANTSSPFSFGQTAAASTNKPVFGNSPKFSFSDLAKQTSSDDKSTSNGTEQRIFASQSSLIFGTSSANTVTGNSNEDDDCEDDSYEPSFPFIPIVQLSPVEVKTGEEDENVLFCERAKLYRFDSAANQMKERGTGEMKILQHKTTNICRILMRREQVLKLYANHQITSQMELKPHQGSENAYVWSAMDFADGEAKHERLCVKFKSSDTAKRFVKQFNDAKQANGHAQQ